MELREAIALEWETRRQFNQSAKSYHLPMLWHVAEPFYAGGLEADVGVEAASDGAVDDGLLLLFQQLDQFLLGD